MKAFEITGSLTCEEKTSVFQLSSIGFSDKKRPRKR